MSNTKNLLFIGLPGSGKTSFLAALWYVLDDQTSTTALKLARLSGDRTYLNQITKEWRDGSQVPRTNLQNEQVVVLHLNGVGFGEFDLSIPDLAGEAFKQQLTDRRMSRHHDRLVQDATGVMLFLHPDVVVKSTQLTTVRQLEATLSGNPTIEAAPAAVPNTWSSDMLPDQVKLVETLQFLLERKQGKLRVAVVVSAWDLVDNMGIPPNDYIAGQLPLLQQFLVANDDLLDHAVFGVSALGGDITDKAERRRILNLDALKRIMVHQGQETNNDITRPLAWLLGSR